MRLWVFFRICIYSMDTMPISYIRVCTVSLYIYIYHIYIYAFVGFLFFFVLQKLELDGFPFQGCTVQYSLLLRTQRSQTCSYGSPPVYKK